MDTNGARLLADRIRARVGVGMAIELLRDVEDGHGLRSGDRGVVTEIRAGRLVVDWDRGFSCELDPGRATYRPLAA